MTIKEEIRALRFRHIKWALERTDGNERKAARLIGLNPTTFSRWMRELHLGNYAATMRRKRDWWLASVYAEILFCFCFLVVTPSLM